MAILPQIIAYAALGVFALACLARVLMWTKMPMHVRWELYPVAHEGKRARYGGSYLEDVDWWKKPREVSLWGEIRAMAPEILLLVALREHNPKLWVRSFPFHFGLYLVIGATALLFADAWLVALAPALMAGLLGQLLHVVTVLCTSVGLTLALFGAAALLHRRLTDPALRDFTAPADLFNLGFFLVAFGVAALAFVAVDRSLVHLGGFVAALATLQAAPAVPALVSAAVVLMGLLVAYIPLTHMSHFIGKYFAYHAIRWADEPNTPGSELEHDIQEVLAYRVSWAAPHINGGGTKTWAEVATSSAEEQK